MVVAAAGAAALGATLGGCSDLYFDRRDTIALSGGDAVNANAITQMVDPWPPQSGNTNIAFNGQKMQSAVERYRTNNVTQPVDPMAMQVATPTTPSSSSGNSQNPASASSSSAAAASQ
jgi:hypothetical protein